MKNIRIYADTSVFGGCFDDEFSEDSKKLVDEIRDGRFTLVLSTTTLDELKYAPDNVRELVASIPEERIEMISLSEEIENLRDSYIKAGVLSSSNLLDAEHVAFATIAGVDLIVSWNFKHMVHYDKIRGYTGVNLLNGYQPIAIHSPSEVV